MHFKGITKQSLADYPGEISAILFTGGCNFRCPFCHNRQLVINLRELQEIDGLTADDAIEFLKERRAFLDAIVISGGEPTLHNDLPDFIRQVKELAYLIKLDTNGTNPVMLEKLIRDKLVDYVAMDVKAPLEFKKYQKACSKLSMEEFFHLRSSIQLLKNADIYVEFRTTVVPALHEFEDILDIAKYLGNNANYTLQQFKSHSTLDPHFQDYKPYNWEDMESLANLCVPYVKKIRLISLA